MPTIGEEDKSELRLEAAVTRALGASRYLQRALVAQGLAPVQAAGAQGDAAARRWLLALAGRRWSAARVQEQFEQILLADRAADPADDPLLVARALRRTRRFLLCGLMIRDCAQIAALEEVMGAMTAFAELAVRASLRAIAPELARRHGVPVDAAGRAQDLMVLAMGKAGARELNVSSDLDLVFVYGADGAHCQEFFDRLGRRLIAALAEQDSDGFVFRVDMRLRPHGDSGPLAVSLAMLEEYLVREGREWERFAWSKARVIAAPVLSAEQDLEAQIGALEAVVHPFVYRKYFDFGAIAAIRDLHRRIGAEALRGSRARRAADATTPAATPAADVKLGRGGIREIEFLVQSFGIMRGGRDHRLRRHGTLAMLQVLGQAGLLPREESARLAEHYRFLRRLEHALQYRDDAQTHLIPADDAGREAVAQLLGMDSAAQMLERYRRASAEVQRSFDAMFPADAPQGADPGPEEGARLEAPALACAGFADAAAALARLQQMMESARFAALSAPGRQAIGRLARHALELIAGIAHEAQVQGKGTQGLADQIWLRWIRLVEVIGRRSTYFSLLSEYPRAHERVLRLLASGGWGAEYLLRHPIVLDELIDPRTPHFGAAAGPRGDEAAHGAQVSADSCADACADARADARADACADAAATEALWRPWAAQVEAQLLAAGSDVERLMNILRDAHHAQVFCLLLDDLAGQLPLERLADHLSALADAVLDLTLRAAWRSLAAAGADPPPMAVVAYGKLGGRELGYASDLDLIFVYGEGPGAEQAERNAAVCNQWVRRVIAWLTTTTSSGVLFDIDLRLRPNGNAGLLVTPIEAFERYQTNADGRGAWVWEHQALTRARACAGDRALGARVEQIRAQVLRQRRDPAALAAEVIAMRLRMLEGHRNRGERFDIKHDRGGMVDIEFLVQFLVLAHARSHEALLENRGNIGLLALAAQLGLADGELAAKCAGAYRHYRQLQHALRLDGAERAQVGRSLLQPQIDAVLALWRSVLGTDQPLLPVPAAAGAPADPGRGPGSPGRGPR